MKTLTANQQLWTDELNSGKHKQGKGGLQYGDRHCCLGVACLVYERETGIKLDRHGGELIGGALRGGYGTVKEWLGLRESFGRMDPTGKDRTSLVVLNDHNSLSFEEIAKVIEDNSDLLFVEETA